MTVLIGKEGAAPVALKGLTVRSFLVAWIALGLSAAAPLCRAKQVPAAPRYVLLVDTSVRMAGQRAAVAQAVEDKVASGFDGKATAGEVFALWPFSDVALTGAFLPVTWSPRTKDLYAKRMARAVEDQPFSGSPRLDHALAQASQLIRSGGALTLFVFTDGTVPMVGTPFDTQ